MAGEVQLAMDLRLPNTWGGARDGAGRKKSRGRRPPQHDARPTVSRHHGQHVVLRTLRDVPRLRTAGLYLAIRGAIAKLLAKPDFRVVHMTIQHNHLHFIVEAENKAALSHGMRALAITCARAINKAVGRTGRVFAHRYHATAITSPKQMRNVLCYVLKNASHCTYRGKRVEFPTSGSHTRLLQGAQRVLRYRRPSFEDFVWGWASMPLPGKIDFKVRYGPGVPEQLHS